MEESTVRPNALFVEGIESVVGSIIFFLSKPIVPYFSLVL